MADSTYDVFICHASEDKADVGNPLADALKAAGLTVWYDALVLRLGDSLRQKIDAGLTSSRFGVVILSQNFFQKNWPQAELDALFNMQMAGTGRILPVWHELKAADVLRLAPLMAGMVAARTADGLDHVVEKILLVVDPTSVHLTQNYLTILAKPKEFEIHSGQWSRRVPVRITNPTDRDLYSVWIKLSFDRMNVEAKSVVVDAGVATTGLTGYIGPVAVSGDVFRWTAIDAAGRQAVYVVIHTMPARSGRELIVSGTTRWRHARRSRS